ncbi:TetR family transcriptional regulator [Bradyrhizobium diazoefficiens]|nr:TetR family transcriptional regulator [Bradyrhizobium diazoefficiens]UCF55281.1 MAG: TetR family transcriptional regulator [Bradyrhizobium sp.]MBR0962805.1 TetR family transcriptional regulator [Bradyrhizobium diazoefficiens]MBR0976965.1 TetR family transcriptional regulator [Bradyrhizobium diazoefficiens]MBR1005610.1 TetR family transcriptional regulator [Bradyrhizobium diazoefficiens]MBR1012083.1 TetR family transcriptional regulator [Bradyrhizobium diazoefficiens]
MASMIRKIDRTERRSDALSRERIIAAAIEILDTGGEGALTVRALAAHLATGSGAIYWHVVDKNELLAAAADAVIARVMSDVAGGAKPREAIRAVAIGVFDAIDAHPWVGAQLFREPGRPATLDIIEGIGRQLRVLGVAKVAQFDTVSALVHYILGVAGQNAANARLVAPGTDRSAFLSSVAAQWTALDPARYPFVRQMASQLRDHDDRAQFLAGVDLILAGIDSAR